MIRTNNVANLLPAGSLHIHLQVIRKMNHRLPWIFRAEIIERNSVAGIL